jgi:hypothetical protein
MADHLFSVIPAVFFWVFSATGQEQGERTATSIVVVGLLLFWRFAPASDATPKGDDGESSETKAEDIFKAVQEIKDDVSDIQERVQSGLEEVGAIRYDVKGIRDLLEDVKEVIEEARPDGPTRLP